MLSGTITPSGNKNAALPILAACLLTAEPVVLHNIPRIRDMEAMRQLIMNLGATVEELDAACNGHSWRISTPQISKTALDPDLCRRIRASILLAGPMLARHGEIELPPPGGDIIGRRRLDTHLLALEALGAQVQYDRTQFFMQAAPRLKGANILLDECSVTGTENTLMASALACGTTVIRNAASEPHVQELCHFLNALGARIDGIGSNMLRVQGVDELHGGEYTIGADYLEVVSFVGAAAVTGGE
ncbi:MAG TPA: UDP-N-acetylglucosamine 1-carboxyvinyltransferase, partial [Rhodocyclaceae bacterium]|nr:UDP-N-acetylglucosamine 1-carboxyvinyltransferase [Rhodocyclaceae bacterium]